MSAYDDDAEVNLVTSSTADATVERVDEPLYPDVYSWVEGWLLQHWRRKKEFWDEKWWDYPEVLSRFEALWRAWEFLRLEGALGMSIFWRDHLESHMRVITAPDGPFWQIRSLDRTGTAPEMWPSAPVDRETAQVTLFRQ